MNKISKKIVSLVTMAAFALTLVPAAAFADPVGESTTYADVTVKDDLLIKAQSATTVPTDVSIDVNDSLTTNDWLVLWFTKDGDVQTTVKYVDLLPAQSSNFGASYTTGGDYSASWWIKGTDSATTSDMQASAKFATAGDYELHAAKWSAGDPTNIKDIAKANPNSVVGEIKVVNETDALSIADSYLLIDGNRTGTAVQNDTKDPAQIEFVVANDNGYDFALDATGGTTYVWVEDANGVIVKDAEISAADNTTLTVNGPSNGIYTVASANNGDLLNVVFPDAGEGYTVNCAVVPAGSGPVQVVADNKVQVPGGAIELDGVTVNVTAEDVVTDEIQFDTVEGKNAGSATVRTDANDVTYYTYTYEIDDKVTPNDLKDYKVVGTALDAGDNPVEGEKLTVACQNADLTLSTNEVTTNAKGQFEFTFSLNNTGDYTITVSELKDKVVGVLNITQDAMAPVSISTTLDDGIMLAGTDDNYIYNQYALMTDAVQFNIKDAYDRDATGETVIKNENAAKEGGVHNDFVDVTAPEGSKLTDADINLAWDADKGVYTIKYVGKDQTADLIPGEYTVKISLNNGKSATATFTLAEFQGAESLDISMTASANTNNAGDANNNAITAVDDQIALGQNVSGKVYLVDAQGLKILAPASNLSVGVNGAAVASNSVTLNNPFSFTTVDNIPANQSVIGSIITVQAYDEVNRMYVEKTLNVVSNYGDETLSFDPTQGPVGETNGVDVTVVDANDKLSKVNGTMTAYIASQSNEDAKITLRANEAVNDGEGRLYLTSDATGTVDVVVAVKADNGEIYGATLTYTFGDEDPYAGSYIVMTIGSDQYLINGEMFDGSADNLGAPYIDSAWRTMVPVRVLAESFGADVEYADNVVTIVDGDTTVVMNIGEETYTVNGEEQTMDTAAVIGDGDRTYVPVRFVAEALGYSVTPLYDANGLTSSVHFSK